MDEHNQFEVLTSYLRELISSYFTGIEPNSNNTIIDDTDYTNNPALSKDTEKEAIVIVNESEQNSEITKNDCPICLESLNTANYVNLKCNDNAVHQYHETCLTMTLNALPNMYGVFECPLCRYEHKYQIEKPGNHRYISIRFQEYWFWKSILICNIFENIILFSVYVFYFIIVTNKLGVKYKNQYSSIRVHMICALVLNGLACFEIPLRKINYLIKTNSAIKIINNKQLFKWSDYPIIVYLISYIHLTIYFSINYLINTNKIGSIILLFSSLPMILIMMF
jgi:hypothetical protein